jgi:hypothetical protein
MVVVVSFLHPLPEGVDEQGLASHFEAHPLLPPARHHHHIDVLGGRSAMVISRSEQDNEDHGLEDDFSTQLPLSGSVVEASHFVVFRSANRKRDEWDLSAFLLTNASINERKHVGEKYTDASLLSYVLSPPTSGDVIAACIRNAHLGQR